MRQACRWVILSVLFLQLCHATSIVVVVSRTGEYVVLAADSREYADVRDPRFNNYKSNNNTCKIIALDDTLFFNSGKVYIAGSELVHPWRSMQIAKEVYKASSNHDTQALSIAWATRAKKWFHDTQSPSGLQSLTYSDGSIVTGGFINFDSTRNPAAFSQTLYVEGGPGGPQTRLNHTLMGHIGKTGVHQELVLEFEKAETPRALKAYGTLKVQDVTQDLSYDIEFAKKAVQFVIDNVPTDEKQMVHGPIDVVVVRRFAGIDWIQRKKSCYSQDLHTSAKKK